MAAQLDPVIPTEEDIRRLIHSHGPLLFRALIELSRQDRDPEIAAAARSELRVRALQLLDMRKL
jgi:hypothetical protein